MLATLAPQLKSEDLWRPGRWERAKGLAQTSPPPRCHVGGEEEAQEQSLVKAKARGSTGWAGWVWVGRWRRPSQDRLTNTEGPRRAVGSRVLGGSGAQEGPNLGWPNGWLCLLDSDPGQS